MAVFYAGGFMSMLDLGNLLDQSAAAAFLHGAELNKHAYAPGEGCLWKSRGDGSGLVQDVVRVSERGLLLASNHAPTGDLKQRQLNKDGDWIHIQFRLDGGGHESLRNHRFQTPENSCIIARYPDNSIVEREIAKQSRWKFVCLYINAGELRRMLDILPAELPAGKSWITAEDSDVAQFEVMPLKTSMVLAANDIFNCGYYGGSRQIYMRAKALELLAIVIESLKSPAIKTDSTACRLSAADLRKLSVIRQIIQSELDENLSLAQLASRVGLNRTKLAVGYKQTFGVSVQADWRDTKLNQARAELMNSDTSVTQIAFQFGYAELSSFTRAFTQRFGITPKECRKNAA